MSPSEHWQLYTGKGVRRGKPVPPATDLEPLTRADGYLADEGLSAAVNVALALGQPLLITGEPGTGKTQLAYSVAYELGLPLLRFDTKTTSTARDLFYRYDALRHFQAAHAGSGGAAMSAMQFIEFEALGRAILLAIGAEGDRLPSDTLTRLEPQRSVVLVDEIDKAPRDLPNDLLNEVEEMRFTIRETGDEIPARHVKVDRAYRPILILTSNSEKNLPDAFLRRCVYYHVPVPKADRLTTIVARRLGITEPPRPPAGDAPGVAAPPAAALPPMERPTTILANAVEHFVRLRDAGLKKKPATAELIAWVRMLVENDVDVGAQLTEAQRRTLAVSYSILAKTREDLDAMTASGVAAR